MTKPIHQQYFETLRAAQKLKPRSERKVHLTRDLHNLIHRQLKLEVKSEPKNENRQDRA